MAGVVLSHEPEVSPCGLHRVATPGRRPGQRHRWLIRWEAQNNKTKQAHPVHRSAILCHTLMASLNLCLSETRLRTLTFPNGAVIASPRSSSTWEARLLLKVTVMAESPQSTTGCSFCQMSDRPSLWPLTFSWPWAQKQSIWLCRCGTSGEKRHLQSNQQTLMLGYTFRKFTLQIPMRSINFLVPVGCKTLS